MEGCADKELSSLGLYSRRDGDRLLVHCNRTDDTWNLVCKDTKWIGSVGDCSPVTGRKILVTRMSQAVNHPSTCAECGSPDRPYTFSTSTGELSSSF